MTELIFLTVDEVIAFHDIQVDLFGGLEGTRDTGLLESAVMGTQSSFGGQYLHEDIFTMAAAYACGIIKNHPFLDGNKRTGMATALTFLYANEKKINPPHEELFALAIAIATSEASLQETASFFKSK